MEEITAQTRELKRTRETGRRWRKGGEKTGLDGGKRNASPAEFFLRLVQCIYIHILYTYKRYQDGGGGYRITATE